VAVFLFFFFGLRASFQRIHSSGATKPQSKRKECEARSSGTRIQLKRNQAANGVDMGDRRAALQDVLEII